MMTATETINADKAYEQDVKTMTYDELMETIRFLDQERETIKQSVQETHEDFQWPKEVLKRAA